MNQKIILNHDAVKIKPRKTWKFENSHFFLLFTGRGRVMEKSFIVISMKHDASYNNSIKNILNFYHVIYRLTLIDLIPKIQGWDEQNLF